MHDIDRTNSDTCNLINYGIRMNVVDALFKSIVWWLDGKDLPWNQTRHLNVFRGPVGRTVAELLFFHYDGPPDREIGGGGEYNHCKLYLYDDHCNISFTGDNPETFCGIWFKYSTRWAETDKGLLVYLLGYLNQHLTKIFESDPHRFNGFDKEVEHVKAVVGIIEGVLSGQVIG